MNSMTIYKNVEKEECGVQVLLDKYAFSVCLVLCFLLMFVIVHTMYVLFD